MPFRTAHINYRFIALPDTSTTPHTNVFTTAQHVKRKTITSYLSERITCNTNTHLTRRHGGFQTSCEPSAAKAHFINSPFGAHTRRMRVCGSDKVAVTKFKVKTSRHIWSEHAPMSTETCAAIYLFNGQSCCASSFGNAFRIAIDRIRVCALYVHPRTCCSWRRILKRPRVDVHVVRRMVAPSGDHDGRHDMATQAYSLRSHLRPRCLCSAHRIMNSSIVSQEEDGQRIVQTCGEGICGWVFR